MKALYLFVCSLVATVAMVMIGSPAQATTGCEAYEVNVDHICYQLDGGNFTAEIRGEDGSLGATLAPPESIIDSGQTYSVTAIGITAFEDNSTIRHVILPNSIRLIGIAAFRQNNSSSVLGITDIQLNDGLLEIDASAFNNTSLVELSIPDSVTTLGFCAACSIDTLTTLRLSQSLTSIPDSAFMYNVNLTYVEIPSSVISIGEAAFYLDPLIALDIPGNVTSIGRMAFSGTQGDVFFQGAPPTLLTSPVDTFGDPVMMHFTCPYASSVVAGMWNGYPAAAYCTVTFHANPGTPVPFAMTTYGGHVSSPSPPTYSEFDFAGWYTDTSFATPFDFSAALVSDESVYAKWVPAVAPEPSPSTHSRASTDSPLASTGINSRSREFDQWIAGGALLAISAGLGMVMRRRKSRR